MCVAVSREDDSSYGVLELPSAARMVTPLCRFLEHTARYCGIGLIAPVVTSQDSTPVKILLALPSPPSNGRVRVLGFGVVIVVLRRPIENVIPAQHLPTEVGEYLVHIHW